MYRIWQLSESTKVQTEDVKQPLKSLNTKQCQRTAHTGSERTAKNVYVLTWLILYTRTVFTRRMHRWELHMTCRCHPLKNQDQMSSESFTLCMNLPLALHLNCGVGGNIQVCSWAGGSKKIGSAKGNAQVPQMWPLGESGCRGCLPKIFWLCGGTLLHSGVSWGSLIWSSYCKVPFLLMSNTFYISSDTQADPNKLHNIKK